MGRLAMLAVLFAIPALGGEPIAIENGYVVVEVRVNDRGPFRMMLDTGASSCAISPESARASGLVFDERVQLETLGGIQTVPGMRRAQVQVGYAGATGVEVLAVELDAARRAAGRIDGVLGQSFLSRFPYLIDYREKRLLIGPEAEMEALRLGPPLAVEQAYGRLVAPVAIEPRGKIWKLVLDSGSDSLILQCGAWCPPHAAGRGLRVHTNGGEREARRVRLERVGIGGVELGKVEAVVMSDTGPNDGTEGCLPMRWFSAVYVDSARKVVRLAR